MVNELLTLKAEAEHEIMYAQAKLEVIGKLLAKVQPIEEPLVEDSEETPTDDIELETV